MKVAILGLAVFLALAGTTAALSASASYDGQNLCASSDATGPVCQPAPLPGGSGGAAGVTCQADLATASAGCQTSL